MPGYVKVKLASVAIGKVVSQYIIWKNYKTLCKPQIEPKFYNRIMRLMSQNQGIRNDIQNKQIQYSKLPQLGGGACVEYSQFR